MTFDSFPKLTPPMVASDVTSREVPCGSALGWATDEGGVWEGRGIV